MGEVVRTGVKTLAEAQRLAGSPQRGALRRELRDAVRHHHVGDLSGASRILDRILEREPDHPEALHLLGLIATQRGNAKSGVRRSSSHKCEVPPSSLRHARTRSGHPGPASRRAVARMRLDCQAFVSPNRASAPQAGQAWH